MPTTTFEMQLNISKQFLSFVYEFMKKFGLREIGKFEV